MSIRNSAVKVRSLFNNKAYLTSFKRKGKFCTKTKRQATIPQYNMASLNAKQPHKKA